MNMSVEESDGTKMNTISKEGALDHSQMTGRNGVVQALSSGRFYYVF